jgi:hypothetical protein
MKNRLKYSIIFLFFIYIILPLQKINAQEIFRTKNEIFSLGYEKNSNTYTGTIFYQKGNEQKEIYRIKNYNFTDQSLQRGRKPLTCEVYSYENNLLGMYIFSSPSSRLVFFEKKNDNWTLVADQGFSSILTYTQGVLEAKFMDSRTFYCRQVAYEIVLKLNEKNEIETVYRKRIDLNKK